MPFLLIIKEMPFSEPLLSTSTLPELILYPIFLKKFNTHIGFFLEKFHIKGTQF